MRKMMVMVTVFALVMAGMAFAQGGKVKVTTKQASGTISSMDSGSLVLKHKVAGKDQETTFILNGETKKEGDAKVGSKVTVHYKVENNQNIVTLVKVAAAKK